MLAWQTGAIDSEWIPSYTGLREPDQLQVVSPSQDFPSTPQSSLLFQLVDLAARTLDQCAPRYGHLASRYAVFLRGMANMVAVTAPPDDPADLGELGSLLPEMHRDPNHSWDREWQDLWQNSGLDQGWIFSNLE